MWVDNDGQLLGYLPHAAFRGARRMPSCDHVSFSPLPCVSLHVSIDLHGGTFGRASVQLCRGRSRLGARVRKEHRRELQLRRRQGRRGGRGRRLQTVPVARFRRRRLVDPARQSLPDARVQMRTVAARHVRCSMTPTVVAIHRLDLYDSDRTQRVLHWSLLWHDQGVGIHALQALVCQKALDRNGARLPATRAAEALVSTGASQHKVSQPHALFVQDVCERGRLPHHLAARVYVACLSEGLGSD
mmetsp:Transcript_16798/g.63934  ORF Transcript_16798/g.63934 Transcript_16798/m.63934 type:complete len:244 (-) Transcript_16798:3681-4412(-)